MSEFPRIGAVRFSAAPSLDIRSGLLGWVSFTLGDLRLDGVAVRKTRDGRLALSFPTRTDARGVRHAVVKPIDDAARRSIEKDIFRTLRLGVDRDDHCDEVRP